jgi:hypothetical protein
MYSAGEINRTYHVAYFKGWLFRLHAGLWRWYYLSLPVVIGAIFY